MKYFSALAGAIALAMAASPAGAADVYSSGGLKDGGGAYVSGQQYNWTGFYIGGYLGMHANNTTLDYASLLTFDGIGSQGLMGGGELGFDFQTGSFVIGVFGRGDFPTAESTLSIGGTAILKDTMNYMWTAGGRAGVLVGSSKSTLIFAEVGYSQAQYDLTALGGFSWTRTPGGITAGGGIETQLGGGFTAKIVYDWTGLDSVDAAAIARGLTFTTDIQRVQIGLDYKLSVGRLPLN